MIKQTKDSPYLQNDYFKKICELVDYHIVLIKRKLKLLLVIVFKKLSDKITVRFLILSKLFIV